MKIKFIIIISLISVLSNSAYAQLDDNIKAKLYFTEAQKLFEQGDFKNSLVYVDKAESTIGKTVARTLALKIKIEYNLGNFIKAKELFDNYTSNYMQGTSQELNDEVLALFINIEEAAEAEKLRLIITVNGRKLEVYKENLGEMNWNDAHIACKRLGAGWRLPTKEELNQIYLQLHKNGKGNFASDWYWSSSEYGNDDAWVQSFGSGRQSDETKYAYATHYVRAIRAF